MKIYLIVRKQEIRSHGSPTDNFFRVLSTNDPYEDQVTNLLPFYTDKEQANRDLKMADIWNGVVIELESI